MFSVFIKCFSVDLSSEADGDVSRVLMSSDIVWNGIIVRKL